MDRINNYAQGVSEIATLESIRNNLGVEASEYTPDESQPERDRVFTFAQQEKVLSILADIDTGVANLVEKADTNAENIATNTANIAQNQGSISANNKRISNIEKLLQGNLYDYQTDPNSAYTKTVPSGALPYAGLESLGGKTVVWNQIIPALNLTNFGYNKSPGTASENPDGSLTYTITTASAYAYLNMLSAIADTCPKIINGHKYYTSIDIKTPGSQVSVRVNASNSTWVTFSVSPNTREKHSLIQTADADETNASKFVYPTWGTGATGECVLYSFNIVDLTLLYGSGNEPTTVEEFTAQFPAQYYAYNEGMLLSAGVTEVVSKKADTTILATYSIPAEVQSLEGYGWSAGSVYNYVDFERKVFVKRVGSVDMGTLSWVKNEANYRIYSTGLTSAKPAEASGTVANALCDFLPTVILGTITVNHLSGLCISTGSPVVNIGIGSNDSTALDNLITSLSGKILYYELATPIETDISEYLTDDNLIQVEAGGTLTFPNSNGTDYQIPIPSEETYMVDLQSALGE